jgi:hypothetical protein
VPDTWVSPAGAGVRFAAAAPPVRTGSIPLTLPSARSGRSPRTGCRPARGAGPGEGVGEQFEPTGRPQACPPPAPGGAAGGPASGGRGSSGRRRWPRPPVAVYPCRGVGAAGTLPGPAASTAAVGPCRTAGEGERMPVRAAVPSPPGHARAGRRRTGVPRLSGAWPRDRPGTSGGTLPYRPRMAPSNASRAAVTPKIMRGLVPPTRQRAVRLPERLEVAAGTPSGYG